MRRYLSCITITGLLLAFPTLADATNEDWLIERFSTWQDQVFEGETQYQLDQKNGLVSGTAKASASGLVLKGPFDLNETPWLEWQWRVRELPSTEDETSKEGDDFGARVYVVIDGGFFRWRTKAMTYVWAKNQPAQRLWQSPYAPKNVTMLSLQSGAEFLGVWKSERRNVQMDLHAAYGKRFNEIDAIAIMTDADNSQSSAAADYRQLRLSKD